MLEKQNAKFRVKIASSEAKLTKMNDEIEQLKAERDNLSACYQRYVDDYTSLKTISDKYEIMLRDLWNYRERTYLKDIEGKSMHAAIYVLYKWKRVLHKQYQREAKKH